MATTFPCMSASTYVLVTAAYNEEAYIEGTIQAVLSQTVRPSRWVIVSDGSIDGTDGIVRRYAAAHDFIRFVRREKDGQKGFASKVFALRAGLEQLGSCQYEFIGHLDADVSFGPSCFSDLIGALQANPQLGLTGGVVLERVRGQFAARRSNSLNSVPGAVQMFRRECYQDIGGFIPIEYGGEDWYAEVRARMNGWQVRINPETEVNHERATGAASGRLRYWYRQGFMDFVLGSHPLFEIAKLIRRIPERPYLTGATVRFCGFVLAHFTTQRVVPAEFVRFLRREQLCRCLPKCFRPKAAQVQPKHGTENHARQAR
jgi:glycosyltransferase involved in cell wall biosynthesis